jgi:hypothetical protein
MKIFSRDLLYKKQREGYITDGLIRWYKLGGNLDESISGYDGLNVGITFTIDPVGDQLVAYMATGYANIPTTNLPSSTNSSFSFSVLVLPIVYESDIRIFIGYGIDSAYRVCCLGVSSANKIYVERGSGGIYTNTDLYTGDNKWKRITCTYDRPTTTLKVYVNDTLILTNTSTTFTLTPNYAVINSWLSGTSSRWFRGYGSNYLIYNHAITAEEIENNYLVDKENFDM